MTQNGGAHVFVCKPCMEKEIFHLATPGNEKGGDTYAYLEALSQIAGTPRFIRHSVIRRPGQRKALCGFTLVPRRRKAA